MIDEFNLHTLLPRIACFRLQFISSLNGHTGVGVGRSCRPLSDDSQAACVVGVLCSRAVSVMLPATAPTHGRLRGGSWHERLMARLAQ